MSGIDALLLRNCNVRRVGALRAAESRLRSEPYYCRDERASGKMEERKEARKEGSRPKN